MSTHVDLQHAVVTALGTANLEFPIEAVAADQAYYDLTEVTEATKVNVVRGNRLMVPFTRGKLNQNDYALHVGVMRRWEGLTDEQLKCKFNEYDAFLEQIVTFLLKQEAFGSAGGNPIAIEMVAPYSADHRERLRQFTAEFILTIRTLER